MNRTLELSNLVWVRPDLDKCCIPSNTCHLLVRGGAAGWGACLATGDRHMGILQRAAGGDNLLERNYRVVCDNEILELVQIQSSDGEQTFVLALWQLLDEL